MNDEENVPEDTEGFKPITTREEFQAVFKKELKPRLERERAKYADYDELRDKAARLAALENAKETEFNERVAALEAEVAEHRRLAQVREWVAEVAERTGVAERVLRGSTLEELEAHAEVLLEMFPKERKPVIANEGSSKVSVGSPADAFASFIETQFKK
jgi:predicted RNase H-like HicB family nuclease